MCGTAPFLRSSGRTSSSSHTHCCASARTPDPNPTPVPAVTAGAHDCVASFAAHDGGVNDLAPVPPPASSDGRGGSGMLLSAGKDRTLCLWRLLPGAGAGATALARYVGHSDAVECVAAAPSGDRCCSGGWDGQLLLWRTGEWPHQGCRGRGGRCVLSRVVDVLKRD